MHLGDRPQRHHVERGRCAGVIHLELWDALEGERTLFERRGDTDFAARLGRVVAALIEGTLRTVTGFAFPAACRGIASVWLGGGGADRAACASAMPVPTRLSPHAVYAGVHGGVTLLDGGRDDGDLVIDLGQTSAKVLRPGSAPWRVARRGQTWDALLHEAMRGDAPRRLVLGLPSELSDQGAGPCSYFERLSWDEIARAVPCPTLVVSDAELAGCAARAEAPILTAGGRGAQPPATAATSEAARPYLALTLGHGVGAALVVS
jgi:hypothetical protein